MVLRAGEAVSAFVRLQRRLDDQWHRLSTSHIVRIEEDPRGMGCTITMSDGFALDVADPADSVERLILWAEHDHRRFVRNGSSA